MNPLNSQNQTQYFITAGMPAITSASASSILKTSVTPLPSVTSLNKNNHSAGIINNQLPTSNQLMDTNNFMAGASFLPVLLTNQTLITNVEQQQQQPQHMQKVTAPAIISVSNSPVVTPSNITTNFMPCNKAPQSIVVPNQPGAGNITYQVLTTQPNNNLGSSVLASQNGTVSVLLTSATTSSAPPPAMAATSAPPSQSFIIRNATTQAFAGSNAVPSIAVPLTSTAVQINKPKTLHQPQQQYQQQFQQQILSQNFNSQQLNPEILKQIVVGNVKSSSLTNTSAGGKTLLKPSMLTTKPTSLGGVQKSNTLSKLTTPTKTDTSLQQQQQNNMSKKNSPVVVKEINKSISSSNENNNISQTVQKLPQVSLLQNSKNKLNANITNTSSTTSIVTNAQKAVTSSTSSPTLATSSSSKYNNLNAENEVRVGNINSEVSLIKKSNLIDGKSKEIIPHTSLLKTSTLKEKHSQQQHEISLLKTTKTISSVNKNSEIQPLLKISTTEKIPSDNPISKCQNLNKEIPFNTEKQESLLKTSKNVSYNEYGFPSKSSPRRSKSLNSNIKPTQNLLKDNNNRRHSEPNDGIHTKMAKKEYIPPILEEQVSIDNKQSNRFDNLDVDSLNSQELDTLLKEFEDEEYLESSGEKVEDISKNGSSEMCNSTEGFLRNNEVQIKSNPMNLLETNTNMNQRVSNDPESDDDVTILSINDASIEPIEIDDDDDDDNDPIKELIVTNKSPYTSQEIKGKQNDLLLCDEQFLISSSSSVSNHSSDQISISFSAQCHSKSTKPRQTTASVKPLNVSSTTKALLTSPILKKSLCERKTIASNTKDEPLNGYSTVLDMLSNYNMLNWRERIGTARGTQLKFQLNEFNLIQVHEKIPNRTKSAYEKPVYERDNLQIKTECNEPTVFYNCRRCNVRASAIDFLAPEFCSLYCLKRDRRKRQQINEEENRCILRKKHRNIVVPSNNNNPPPLAYISQPKFRWSSYLKANLTTIAAPISLFLNPFPTGPNNFHIGMKLEAIDPENCSLFCVCTVIDIKGYRLKLSFDGYDKAYDFWLNADSMDIFPPGWCNKTNRILQPPKGISANKFIWGAYLNKEKAIAAPRHLFTHLNSSSLIPRNQFEIGMHLEAEDLNDTGKLCVASVADVLDDRIRIHFDGWDDCYDIIVDINSPYIHPCGWHEMRQQLVVPPDCEISSFNWEEYIQKQGTGKAASEDLFVPRDPINFRPNMKLEVVDPRNSSLIRPATVVTHKGHRVKLHLDGWPNDYCFWLEDDSPDLHPIGWCDATGHELEPPPGFHMAKQKLPCPISGCRGIGNAKKMHLDIHSSRDCCPYAPENWRIVMEKAPRICDEDITRTLPKPDKNQQNSKRLSDQEILERIEILDNIKTRNMIMQQDKVTSSPKDVLGFSSLSREKRDKSKDNDKFDVTDLSASSELSPSLSLSNKTEEEKLLLVTQDLNIQIAKEFLCDYGPRLKQSYALWLNNVPFDAVKIKNNPMFWSVSEVVKFVEELLHTTGKSSELFVQEDIDGEAFLLLQQSDLTERLGFKLGPAVKLYTCILHLRILAVAKFNVCSHYRKP